VAEWTTKEYLSSEAEAAAAVEARLSERAAVALYD
jgi:hypothetical protein